MRRAPLGTRDDYAIVVGWIAVLLAAAFLINIMAVMTRPALSAPLNFPNSAAAPLAKPVAQKHSRSLRRSRARHVSRAAARVPPPSARAADAVMKKQDRLPLAASARVDEVFNAIALDPSRECGPVNFQGGQ